MTAILVLSEQALILLKHIQYIDKIAEHVARQDKLQNQLTNLNIKMLLCPLKIYFSDLKF